jgi:hypothetical protein
MSGFLPKTSNASDGILWLDWPLNVTRNPRTRVQQGFLRLLVMVVVPLTIRLMHRKVKFLEGQRATADVD